MSQQQLDIFNQFFHLESKLTQVTEYKLDKLFDYHLEDETTESIENEYDEKFGGDNLITYQNEYAHSIFHTKTNEQIKDIETPQDIIQFIKTEMTAWLETNG